MNEKQKLDDEDADDTYVLDDETLEELDEASLTSLVSDLTNTMKRPKIDPSALTDEPADPNDESETDTGQPGG